MTSTILKPLSLISVSGAFISLMSVFAVALLLLIVERYAEAKYYSTTSLQLNEKQNIINEFKDTVIGLVEKIEKCERDKQFVDLMDELGSIYYNFKEKVDL